MAIDSLSMINSILKSLEILVLDSIKRAGFDKTYRGRITRIFTNRYRIDIQGNEYDVPYKGTPAFNVGDIVNVLAPQNNFSDICMSGGGSSLGPGDEITITAEDGKDAYQIAVDNGFRGNRTQWLESLKGKDGHNGKDGKDGSNGRDGKSAYEIAIEFGFIGTESEWLESLKGSGEGGGGNGGNETPSISNYNDLTNRPMLAGVLIEGNHPLSYYGIQAAGNYLTEEDVNSLLSNINSNISNLKTSVSNLSASLANKVDKISGKGLSTNDFTNAYKKKLDELDTSNNNTTITVNSKSPDSKGTSM